VRTRISSGCFFCSALQGSDHCGVCYFLRELCKDEIIISVFSLRPL
jgi:hypothetical protein